MHWGSGRPKKTILPQRHTAKSGGWHNPQFRTVGLIIKAVFIVLRQFPSDVHHMMLVGCSERIKEAEKNLVFGNTFCFF